MTAQAFEYALLAAGSYDDIRTALLENRAPVPAGWTELTTYATSGSGINSTLLGSGFSASVYQNTSGEIVIRIAGTEFGNSPGGLALDFLAGNFPLATGTANGQALEAAKLYQKIKADFGSTITFTGLIVPRMYLRRHPFKNRLIRPKPRFWQTFSR
jgi:hypothetical protein